MDKRNVNVDLLDKCFNAARKNPNFKMTNSENCIDGSYTEPDTGEVPGNCSVERHAEKYGISIYCLRNWYIPGTAPELWEGINCCNVEQCISSVKTIVEKHHGPQNWMS